MMPDNTSSYGSPVFLGLAHGAASRAEVEPGEAIVAIILAMIAIETSVNEIAQLSSEEGFARLAPPSVETLGFILDELEGQRASVRSKLQMLHLVLKGDRADVGKAPYQDLSLLIQIRNALVHNRPERYEHADSYEPHKLVAQLAQRGVIEMPSSNQPPDFFLRVASARVAHWACRVAKEVLTYIIALVPHSMFRVILCKMYQIPLPEPSDG